MCHMKICHIRILVRIISSRPIKLKCDFDFLVT